VAAALLLLQVFYLIDFCYFVNIVTAVFLVWFPNNAQLEALVYALADGPIAGALVAWQCPWVFGSGEHTVRCGLLMCGAILGAGVVLFSAAAVMSRRNASKLCFPNHVSNLTPWVPSQALNRRCMAHEAAGTCLQQQEHAVDVLV
jgi:hypothetical protein